MSIITTAFGGELLGLIFQGMAIPNIADNAASAPLGVWEFSLHSAKPSSSQAHQEVTYTGYARIALTRSNSAFTVTGNILTFVNEIAFPEVSSGIGTATYLGVGTAHTGTGALKFRLPISPAIAIYPGQVPKIKTVSTIALGG